MQGALVSARCCSVQVFANAKAGESDAVLGVPFRPGKTPGMAKPCRMPAGLMRKPLGVGAFLRFGRNHSFDTIAKQHSEK